MNAKLAAARREKLQAQEIIVADLSKVAMTTITQPLLTAERALFASLFLRLADGQSSQRKNQIE